jgi:hypothetical protein
MITFYCVFHIGAGKSTVIKEIRKIFSQNGKCCEIVCSSGVACNIYEGLARTVHSFYGLNTAELPASLLIQRSLDQQDVVDRIKSLDVLIWDEISMSSMRLLNIVNLLQQNIHNNTLPFGGIQVILGGDFYQLKPIPDVIDAGDSAYKSIIFDKVFPHRIALTRIMRQGDTEMRLKDALDSLRLGKCDDETEAYLRGLSRSCASTDEEPPIHIYFTKLPTAVHNSYMLTNLPGEALKFKSIDTGRKALLNNTVAEVLMLKPGCKVMLLFNVNNNLKNGTFGTFLNSSGDSNSLQVKFPNLGVVNLQRKTWYKYDKSGNIQASRTQFPLSLSYAITVHKAQSTTLDSVVVHCSQEFDSGQTYVAISRVKSEENLQVIGFNKRYLLPPPPEIAQVSTTQHGNPVQTLECCSKIDLDGENYKLDRDTNEFVDDGHPSLFDTDIATQEEIAKQCFEENQGSTVDLHRILHSMTNGDTRLVSPPPAFSIMTFLESLKNDSSTDEVSEHVKAAANYGIENLPIFELLTKVLWRRVAHLFDDYISENAGEVQISSRNFTRITAKLNELFLTNEYRSDIMAAFSIRKWSDITCGQRCLGAQLLFHIYQLFVAEVRKLANMGEIEQITLQVSEMGADGRGKVRYIGGWAVRKLLEKSKRYIIENNQSETKEVIERVSREMTKVLLLQNNLIVPSQILQETTKQPETLHLTESRQFREHGLLNISDGAYEFFMILEQQRVNQINSARLSQQGPKLVEDSIDSVTKDQVLQDTFLNLFQLEHNGNKVSENQWKFAIKDNLN